MFTFCYAVGLQSALYPPGVKRIIRIRVCFQHGSDTVKLYRGYFLFGSRKFSGVHHPHHNTSHFVERVTATSGLFVVEIKISPSHLVAFASGDELN